tara:strand:+ start:580 stop:1245 length:666 start_codon:yes stop_codon:yes gene_type:complete
MSWVMVGIAVVGTAAKLVTADQQKKDAERREIEARNEMERQKDIFASLDTSNPYLNMENTMEDLTVNQQQAEFQAQQNAQSQANILDNLRSAAGGSGIAALAQAMANQGTLAAQQASASIGQQEAANQRLAAQEASNIQNLERQGEIMSRNMERDKVATLLGMSQAEVTGARQDIAAANAAQLQAIDSGMATAGAGISQWQTNEQAALDRQHELLLAQANG